MFYQVMPLYLTSEFTMTMFSHKSVHTCELTSAIIVFLGLLHVISFQALEIQPNVVVIYLALKKRHFRNTYW